MSTGITDLSFGWANIIPVTSTGGYIDTGVIGELNGNLNTEVAQLRAYRQCSPLKSIISKRAQAFNNGEISIIDVNGKEVTNTTATTMLDKLKKPNPFQTHSQFFAQQNSYLDIFGWCLMLKKPLSLGFKDLGNLWNMPPWMLNPEYTNNWIAETKISGIISSFTFSFQGDITTLDPEDFSLLFDDGFGTDPNINMLIPDSRLIGNEWAVSTIIGSGKAANTMINKKGALGILSNKSQDAAGLIPMQEKDKVALQNEFRRYGMTGQEWQIIISESNLEWQPMTMSVRDLMIIELEASAVMKLCDSYGYPYRLLAQEKSASYNDVSEFRKDFYSDTIIPASGSRWEQRTSALLADTGLFFKCDYSNLPALQEDKQKAATALKTQMDAVEKMFKNNLITLDVSRILTNQEPVNDSFGKMYYYQLLEAGWAFGNTTINGGDNLPVPVVPANPTP